METSTQDSPRIDLTAAAKITGKSEHSTRRLLKKIGIPVFRERGDLRHYWYESDVVAAKDRPREFIQIKRKSQKRKKKPA